MWHHMQRENHSVTTPQDVRVKLVVGLTKHTLSVSIRMFKPPAGTLLTQSLSNLHSDTADLEYSMLAVHCSSLLGLLPCALDG